LNSQFGDFQFRVVLVAPSKQHFPAPPVSSSRLGWQRQHGNESEGVDEAAVSLSGLTAAGDEGSHKLMLDDLSKMTAKSRSWSEGPPPYSGL